jgi:membrane associated rhomboid family serine protease
MVFLLVFGVNVESEYGTVFYASLHFSLMIISNAINLVLNSIVIFIVPYSILGNTDIGGGPKYLSICSVGYSNIIYGVVMLFAFVGDEY